MQAVLRPSVLAARITVAHHRVGRIVGGLAALSLLADGGIKVLRLTPAVEAATRLGFPARLTRGVGLLELACLLVYLLPRTAPLGAVLLTGYLGGAVAVQVRLGASPFNVLFPVALGALLWGGLYLRDARLRALLAPRP